MHVECAGNLRGGRGNLFLFLLAGPANEREQETGNREASFPRFTGFFMREEEDPSRTRGELRKFRIVVGRAQPMEPGSRKDDDRKRASEPEDSN